MKKLLFAICTICLVAACSSKASDSKTTTAETVADVVESDMVSEDVDSDSQQYQDLALMGISGNTVKVSDYVGKNKLVLIDFWASWCGPCRAEMPAVVKTYQAFHDKGLEIVGVSFDNNREAWSRAVEELKMNWPQMSDLKGWESQGAQVYNIRAIPANVLIDQEGMIIAKDLRGEDLFNMVAKQLK